MSDEPATIEEEEAPTFEYEGEFQSAAEIREIIAQERPGLLKPYTGWVQEHSGQVQETSGANNSATFTIVTRSKKPNRNGNIVQITPGPAGEGMQVGYFEQNPVVLFAHGDMAIPIGKSDPIKRSATKAVATVRFSELDHAAPIVAAVHEGLLRMASIGFMPERAMRLKRPKELLPEDVESLQWYGFDFTQSDLMEWSIVPVGADPGAMRQAVERGQIGGIKLTPWAKQTFEVFAEKPKVWAPGMKIERQMIEPAGVLIEGPAERVADAVAKITAAAAAQKISEKPIDGNPPQPKIETRHAEPQPDLMTQIIAAFGKAIPTKVEPRAIDTTPYTQAIGACLTSAITEAMKPTQQVIDGLDQRLQTALGRKA